MHTISQEIHEHNHSVGVGWVPGLHQGRLRDYHEEMQLPRRRQWKGEMVRQERLAGRPGDA